MALTTWRSASAAVIPGGSLRRPRSSHSDSNIRYGLIALAP